MSTVIIRSLKNKKTSTILWEMLESGRKMGWFDQLRDKKKVVIKPNLCYLAPPESGITTDPKTVEIIITYLRKVDPKIKITIVESDNSDRKCNDAFKQLGYQELAEKYDMEIMNLTKGSCKEVTIPGLRYPINISDIFFEDVFFISVANLKVHQYQKMTGIFKNQFGCVPDEIKIKYHQYLEETLYALNKMIKPDISIIDGRVGLEGIGPVTGSPIKTEIMMMANDPTAMDTVAAKVMGLNPKEVPHLSYVYKKEKKGPNDYKMVGMDKLPVFDFKTDRSFNLIRAKINVTRLTDSLNKSLKNFTSWVYNIPSFIKRAYGFGVRRLKKVVGK